MAATKHALDLDSKFNDEMNFCGSKEEEGIWWNREQQLSSASLESFSSTRFSSSLLSRSYDRRDVSGSYSMNEHDGDLPKLDERLLWRLGWLWLLNLAEAETGMGTGMGMVMGAFGNATAGDGE